jgi:Tfp pilus assembly protein PilV
MIELLISMALASVGLAGLLALQVTAMRGNANSREFTEAVGLAQERLETVEAMPYANLPTLALGTCTQPGQAFSDGEPLSVIASPTTTYSRCTQVNVNGATTYVKVVVQWRDVNNVVATYHYVTVETTRSP